MGVTMKDIKELRSRTGAGVLDCKKALNKVDGDIEAAVDHLREKGMAAAAKKAGRVAAEGLVSLNISDDRQKGVLVEVNSETDFVAKNDNFQELVDQISEHIMQSEKENVEDILSEQWYKDQDKDVNTIIKEAIASIGENINLRRMMKYNTEGFLQDYIHLGGKIGVLVDVDGEYNEENIEVAKNIAMHIAASSPQYISREEISEEELGILDSLDEEGFTAFQEAGKYAIVPDGDDINEIMEMPIKNQKEMFGETLKTREKAFKKAEKQMEEMLDDSTDLIAFQIGLKAFEETYTDSKN